jgi:CubicO group peptidase (beta-lactamase class C family)
MRMCDTTPFLDELAASVVAEGTAPVAAVGWGTWRADGSTHLERGGAVARVFDLASVTKVATAVAIARAGLAPTTPLGALLPELAESASGRATLEDLLSHRAGLQGHVELFAPLRDGAPAIDVTASLAVAADARRPGCAGAIPPGGFPALYSDLGYVLAGAALARATGDVDAGAAAERLVAGPLQVKLGTARGLGAVDYVPTEITTWRSPDPLRGIVHDENALALTGLGGSGHAGLFGDVTAVLTLGLAIECMLHGDGPLACATPPTWLVVPREGTTWRAGFDGKSAAGSSAGDFAAASSFGHLGFTGTSVWIDPERRVVTCLLTNRVNPSRTNLRIKTTRPRVHDALFRHAATP